LSVMNDDSLHDFQRRVAMVDDQIRKADMLEAENQIDAALAAYQSCFEIAIRQNVPVYISQLAHIWMGVGFCYADRYQWERALQMYQLVENMLKSTTTVASSSTQPIGEELDARVQEWSRFLRERRCFSNS
jgi:tetratricopeptide (TPR) repeat protein